MTGLGNRRKLAKVLGEWLVNASQDSPLVLMMFDLDGFKAYNDTFGHGAGDALLARLGRKLDTAVSPHGSAYQRWDGQGYPDHLRASEIPLAARIVAVCDGYDAIVTDRCYSPTRTPQAAREELAREAGHQFDPEVVAAFLEELNQADSYPSDADAQHPHLRAEDNHARLAAQVVCHVQELLEPRG